jgi:hypothetical protein
MRILVRDHGEEEDGGEEKEVRDGQLDGVGREA